MKKTFFIFVVFVGLILLFFCASDISQYNNSVALVMEEGAITSAEWWNQSLSILESTGALQQATGKLQAGAGAIYWEQYIGQNSGENLIYYLSNGDIFWQQIADKDTPKTSWQIHSTCCTARYYDKQKEEWVVLQDPDRDKFSTTLFLSFDHLELILVPPLAYEEMENSCLRSLVHQDGAVTINRIKEGDWQVTISWPTFLRKNNGLRYWWVFASDQELIDWSNPTLSFIWSGYSFTDELRWCGDGLYQEAPADYQPGGKGVFFLNPATYIPARFILTGGSRAADGIGVIMLDIVRRKYNEEGYIPVSTSSGWLYQDYNIGPGYFDTRWNTDLAQAYFVAGRKFQVPDFTKTALRYAAFLKKHIQEEGFSLPERQGILPPDYGWYGAHKTTHASLNHVLAEALFFYQTEVKEYINVADQLILAIEEIGTDWLLPDGNLQYGFCLDGSTVGVDYPYLTYNDLYAIQAYYNSVHRAPSVILTLLMESKRAWMDQHGIVEYKK